MYTDRVQFNKMNIMLSQLFAFVLWQFGWKLLRQTIETLLQHDEKKKQ